jgi:hypothetical protein
MQAEGAASEDAHHQAAFAGEGDQTEADQKEDDSAGAGDGAEDDRRGEEDHAQEVFEEEPEVIGEEVSALPGGRVGIIMKGCRRIAVGHRRLERF